MAYKALEHAKKNSFDYLLIDTAGRLQNKKNLMDEFKKITKVVKKIDLNVEEKKNFKVSVTAVKELFKAAVKIDPSLGN